MAADVEEDDDDETCGFCRFMKAGGCKPEFTVGAPPTEQSFPCGAHCRVASGLTLLHGLVMQRRHASSRHDHQVYSP